MEEFLKLTNGKKMLNNFLREKIVNLKVHKYTAKNGSFLEYIQNQLKLSAINDWNFLCSAMDTICDSQDVIEEFLLFGMEGKTKVSTRGEKLMRLYGVLNAVNVEKLAFFKLLEIFSVPNKIEEEKKIKNLKIMELRNVSAHMIQYKENNKIEAFFYAVHNPENFKITLGKHTSHFQKYEYNLEELINEYQKESFYLFSKILKKIITTIYKNNTEKRNLQLKGIQDIEDICEKKLMLIGNRKFHIILNSKNNFE